MQTVQPGSSDVAAGSAASGSLSRVVGIGASAGGLEALEQFLSAVELGSGCAFVVAQHLSPEHPSLIVELLARSTSMRVVEAVDGITVRPDVVVVVPPNHDANLVGDRLHLLQPPGRLSPSIDALLESLADQWGSHAVGVVLSGTGTDGAHGLRAIRGAGGLTMVQSPTSARFDGMPRAAIELGGVDLVGEPDVLALRLSELRPTDDAHPDSPEATSVTDALRTITGRLWRSIGIDFSRYKSSTLTRQVRRRMAIRQVNDLDAYLTLVEHDAEEAHALASNLLVNVTSFFRDPEAFAAFRDAIAHYLARMEPADVLRVWVPGCATGEEVYSIAMLVGEALGFPANLHHRLKVFGTDLDETSLDIARRAVYSESSLSKIPERLRAPYTRLTAEGVHMAEVLRECTVFARHDVGVDPPFPRIDVISCRNTLIYFTPAQQQQVVRAFAFALKSGGLLFLGKAETLERGTPGFHAVDAEAHVFTRIHGGPVRVSRPSPAQRSRPPEGVLPVARATASRDAALEHQVELLEALVRFSGQAFLVLDDEHNLVQVVGDVSAYCRVPEGRIVTAGGSFLRPELQDEARALFLLSRADKSSATGQVIHLDEPDIAVRLRANPIQVGDEQFTLLAFLPVSEEQAGAVEPATRSASFDNELARLERELLASQDTLRRSLAELQGTNEELEASSEELQAASEELQASNEELEASNEELQATNEELGSLNQVLRQRSEELQRLNIDLENIQASLSQGMVIVDRELRVTRFTPLAVRVFALVDTDVGHPLAGARTTVSIPDLDALLRSVISGEGQRSVQIGDATVSYLMQVLPYHAQDGQCLGAIVTLTDVTELDQLRNVAETALSELHEKSEQLVQRAAHDAATGLLNRGYFAETLGQEIARSGRAHGGLAVVWVDLDNFKEVNDTYGHEAGDVTLRTVAERLVACVRSTDFVGRLGGDEFGVIVAGYENLAELDAILERMVAALRQPVPIGAEEVQVSGSVGVALYPGDGGDANELMRASDEAMYSVKRASGSGFSYFDTAMDAAADTRRAMRADIAEALDDADFELHYQPIVSAGAGVVWGMEALVRWRRGDQLVAAADFVPFCEESGQIRALGLLTLGLLRQDLHAVRDSGLEQVLVGINMSAAQLEDPRMSALLDTWPAPGGLTGLVIEVEHSVFAAENQRCRDTLQTMAALGAKVSIDDLGSGAYSLQLLQSLAPSYVKLDRWFFAESGTVEARLPRVRAAVEISHVIGAKVIAKGVEEETQRRFLVDAGIDFIQGNLISEPMPLADLISWLANQRRT